MQQIEEQLCILLGHLLRATFLAFRFLRCFSTFRDLFNPFNLLFSVLYLALEWQHILSGVTPDCLIMTRFVVKDATMVLRVGWSRGLPLEIEQCLWVPL